VNGTRNEGKEESKRREEVGDEFHGGRGDFFLHFAFISRRYVGCGLSGQAAE
jgi:hypothetical protein